MVYPPSWLFSQSVWGHYTTLQLSFKIYVAVILNGSTVHCKMNLTQCFNAFSAASENGCLVYFGSSWLSPADQLSSTLALYNCPTPCITCLCDIGCARLAQLEVTTSIISCCLLVTQENDFKSTSNMTCHNMRYQIQVRAYFQFDFVFSPFFFSQNTQSFARQCRCKISSVEQTDCNIIIRTLQ